jgi:hypothetical protein
VQETLSPEPRLSSLTFVASSQKSDGRRGEIPSEETGSASFGTCKIASTNEGATCRREGYFFTATLYILARFANINFDRGSQFILVVILYEDNGFEPIGSPHPIDRIYSTGIVWSFSPVNDNSSSKAFIRRDHGTAAWPTLSSNLSYEV